MALSNDLISQFVKVTKDKDMAKKEETVYGTTVMYNGTMHVKIDGSDLLTPVETTADMDAGERVTVMIKNHTATVTGNVSSPAARTDDVKEIGNKISEFEIVIADKVSTTEFDAEVARIDELQTENATIKGQLSAANADIEELQADNVTINDTLTANSADIKELRTTKLDADIADLKYATIEDLDTTNATIYNLQSTYGEFVDLTTDKFEAVNATINSLDTQYANIDFSNIGKAAMEYFYANSGLIKDVVVGDQTITGNLVGVTISGDLIEGNTIVADKLVIKGNDGLYYKLNTDGVTTEAEQTEYNSLNGQVIKAKSITATKISVNDLVAFDATIGGFNITDDSIYSGVKETVNNNTRGVYMDNDGQFAIGDANHFVKYYKDQNGNYKLAISAESFTFTTTGKTIEETINEVKDEVATLLRIESSRGTVFKNNNISTVLSVVIYHGSNRITDITTLKSVIGSSAYLQWKWQKLDETSYGVISADDSRIGNGGFTFTLSPKDVDTKVTFMCELIV